MKILRDRSNEDQLNRSVSVKFHIKKSNQSCAVKFVREGRRLKL